MPRVNRRLLKNSIKACRSVTSEGAVAPALTFGVAATRAEASIRRIFSVALTIE